MSAAKVRFSALSDMGCVRKNNEDMACVDGELVRDGGSDGEVALDGTPTAFAVADGMGGYEGGEVASEIVCRSFRAFIKGLDAENDDDFLVKIKSWASEANRLVLETAAVRPGLSEMGTTFVGLVFAVGKLWLVNIGDSRCYRLRGGVLKQLSKDHSERERTGDPDTPSNLIYNFMGNPPEYFISDISRLSPVGGDVYILCSDGLSDMVDDETIEALAESPAALVAKAKEAGGRDNVTVISLRYDTVG